FRTYLHEHAAPAREHDTGPATLACRDIATRRATVKQIRRARHRTSSVPRLRTLARSASEGTLLRTTAPAWIPDLHAGARSASKGTRSRPCHLGMPRHRYASRHGEASPSRAPQNKFCATAAYTSPQRQRGNTTENYSARLDS